MPLVPAKILGPITPLSPSIRAEHVLPDAVASIAVNGAAINRTQMASANVVDIPLLGSSLSPQDVVTITWSLGGETSKPSLPEIVMNYPIKLPPPYLSSLSAPHFLSSIHTVADWVAIGGLYPGATVEVFSSNTLIGGPETAISATLQVEIHGVIAAGDELRAVQTVQVPGGGAVVGREGHSLGAERRFISDEPPAQPVIIGPIHECAGAVLVGGAVPGCYVELRTAGDVWEYRAVGETFWALLPKVAHAPASFEATSVLRRLNRRSIPSGPVSVDPSQSLDTPLLAPHTQHCPLTVAVTASHLSPGTGLTFEMQGASGTTILGRAGAPVDSTSDSYYFGDLSPLVPASPPFPQIFLTESACSLSARSNAANVWQPSSLHAFPPGFSAPPMACSWWLNVLGIAGCVVTVHSDASDWPVLAYWKQANPDGWILLNRSLRAGEHVWVTIESGCVRDDLRNSAHVRVKDHGNLNALTLEKPVRPGQNRTVSISGAIPGGRVHVFVNDALRASVWATGPISSSVLEVYVGNLVERNKITVCQEMCGEVGELSAPAFAAMGQMILDASPNFVERGQGASMTIHARDLETGGVLLYTGGVSPIYGPSGFAGYTNQPFTVTAAASTASPIHFTVNAEGYKPGAIDVAIHEPTPPPPATLTIKSQSAIGVQKQVIKEIEWTLIGAGQKFEGSQKPNTTSCTVAISLPTPPGGAHVDFALSGKATIEFIHPVTLENMTRPVTVFKTFYGYMGSITVDNWNGTPRSMEVNIGWAPTFDPQTGAQNGEVYYFILN